MKDVGELTHWREFGADGLLHPIEAEREAWREAARTALQPEVHFGTGHLPDGIEALEVDD